MPLPSLNIFAYADAHAAASDADELERLWALRDAFAAAIHTQASKAQPVLTKLRKATQDVRKVCAP